MPNKVIYRFSPRQLLDLLAVAWEPNQIEKRVEAADIIAFATTNQKEYYDRCYQPLFIKVDEWAILLLHKGYSIPLILYVTKKLIKLYVGLFLILEKIGHLAYKFDISAD